MTRKPPDATRRAWPAPSPIAATCSPARSPPAGSCSSTCARFLRDLAAAEAGDGPWAFRPELAERAMIFAGLMPNIKGPKPGDRCA